MKIFKKYISFSKLLVFLLVLAFFGILVFDGYIVTRLIDMITNGYSLAYATVIGTIVSVMSTFSNGVIMFGVKNYMEKAAKENVVGYDAKTNTISEERMKQMMNETMDDVDVEECDF
ncbi:MAG: hypothetical protein ACI4RF_05925 [Eubacterium sp.]